MTQKQIIGVIIVTIVVLAAFVIVYRQLAKPFLTLQTPVSQSVTSTEINTQAVKSAEIPSSIDDIAKSIEDETSVDRSAMDAEETGELSDINTDSQNINDLGKSYDENNL